MFLNLIETIRLACEAPTAGTLPSTAVHLSSHYFIWLVLKVKYGDLEVNMGNTLTPAQVKIEVF